MITIEVLFDRLMEMEKAHVLPPLSFGEKHFTILLEPPIKVGLNAEKQLLVHENQIISFKDDTFIARVYIIAVNSYLKKAIQISPLLNAEIYVEHLFMCKSEKIVDFIIARYGDNYGTPTLDDCNSPKKYPATRLKDPYSGEAVGIISEHPGLRFEIMLNTIPYRILPGWFEDRVLICSLELDNLVITGRLQVLLNVMNAQIIMQAALSPTTIERSIVLDKNSEARYTLCFSANPNGVHASIQGPRLPEMATLEFDLKNMGKVGECQTLLEVLTLARSYTLNGSKSDLGDFLKCIL